MKPATDVPQGDAVRRYWSLAIITTLLVCCMHVGLIVLIDNTNIGTTNGLWKSPVVAAWEHGAEAPLDSGGFLYAPIYGELARLLPDAWFQYGTPPAEVTFRKMALLNGIFGALASGFVCLLALRITNSLPATTIVVLAHAGAAFILLNSLNSEDIIPAYAFFVGSSVALFEFLYSRKTWLLGASVLMFALATLTHWTMMAPGLAAYAAVFALAGSRKRTYLWIGAAWFFLFLCAAQFLILCAFPRLHIPIWAVVLPAKANAAGWVGFRPEKLVLFLVGVGNYLSGGYNLADYHNAFHGRVLASMIASWAYGLLAAGACISVLWDRNARTFSKYVAIFAAVLFLAGEIGNIYSQPQDPQMQVQPMFASIVGLGLLARRCTKWQPSRQLTAGVVSAVLFAANGWWNLRVMDSDPREDSRSVALIQKLDKLFPHSNTVIVSLGYEGWITWEYLLLFPNNTPAFLTRSFHLARPFTMNRGISGRDAAIMMRHQIDTAFANGLRVVATSIWTDPPDECIGALMTATSEVEARPYCSMLRDSYRLGQRWQTSLLNPA